MVGVCIRRGVEVVGGPATEIDEVLGTHRRRTVYNVRDGHRACIVEAHLASLSLLGGDEHHTVGSTATIDGCGRCILQDVDALNVARVQGLNGRSRHQGHSVDHIEWRIGGTDGALTAYADAAQLAGTLVGGDVNTGGLALQCFEGVVHGAGVQLLLANVHHRACHVAALLRAIAHHHHLVEQLAVFLHGHVQLALAVNSHGARSIAHIRDVQAGTCWDIADGVVAIQISHHTIAGALHHHAGANHGFAIGIHYLTCHPALCRRSYGAHKDEQQEHEPTECSPPSTQHDTFVRVSHKVFVS